MRVVLEDLARQFANSDRAAVNKINLVIGSGELAVLLGPSGCGKTTTLRMIAGLEQPDSGRITIEDRDITDLAPKDRRVAMVFQNFSMYPTMNVYDNIAFPLHAIKMDRKEIDRTVREVARLVNIDHRRHHDRDGRSRERLRCRAESGGIGRLHDWRGGLEREYGSAAQL